MNTGVDLVSVLTHLQIGGPWYTPHVSVGVGPRLSRSPTAKVKPLTKEFYYLFINDNEHFIWPLLKVTFVKSLIRIDELTGPNP